MLEILFLTVMSIVCKLAEDCRKIGLLRNSSRRLKNLHGIYEALNIHLVTSLAVFAFLLSNSHEINPSYISCMFVIVLTGVVSKGVFSCHKPERLEWADPDARWGLIVPNGCAIASMIIGLVATYRFPTTDILYILFKNFI